MAKPGCGVSVSGLARPVAVFETVALAIHFEEVHMVGQPVEKRARQGFGARGAGPLIERQVGRHNGGPDNGGPALVAL